ncbi:MAG: hypothetical protein A2W01_11220 [Candidatus Solincola sediminis]|nr:MAG: hypothetical protein A2W01_11220 [Candidatus Solincola sediminis]
MACIACNSVWVFDDVVHECDQPDKYEQYMGIDDVKRVWLRCKNCKAYYQTRNYPLERLEAIYKNGYRDKEFRGESIEEAYRKVLHLPRSESENVARVWWLSGKVLGDISTALDIGSGLGILPVSMKNFCSEVECVEENYESIRHLRDNLSLRCFSSLPNKEYDLVTLVHVLEHVQKLDDFLKAFRSRCKKYLFVEVPDSIEFKMLPKEHDEFNSCHLWFFNPQGLITVLERNGFIVEDLHRQHYPARNLSRIMALAYAA